MEINQLILCYEKCGEILCSGLGNSQFEYIYLYTNIFKCTFTHTFMYTRMLECKFNISIHLMYFFFYISSTFSTNKH
jgi:hypothetical protein